MIGLVGLLTNVLALGSAIACIYCAVKMVRNPGEWKKYGILTLLFFMIVLALGFGYIFGTLAIVASI